jgi:virulence factor Mce-like protein
VSRRYWSNVVWGAVVALAAAAVSYWAFGGPLPSFGGYEVRAVMANASELRPSSPVRIAGVEVGEVKKIGKGPGTTATVTLRLRDSGRPIHRDATLKVRPRLFLEGNFFVDLRPGSPSAPELEDGGTIPLAQTATPVQLDQVLGALPADGRESLRGALLELGRASRSGGAQALGRALDPASGAFRGAAIVSRALRGQRSHDLSEAVRHVGTLTATLDERRTEVVGLVRGLEGLAGALADRDAELAGTIRGLDAVMRQAADTLPHVVPAVRETRALFDDARPLARRLPGTLDELRPLLRELAAILAARELPATARALRPPLRTLGGLQPDLERLLDLVTPVTDCVRDRAAPVLKATVEDGHLSTGQPVWVELLHAMVGLASASQDFDGNGTAVRYLAGFGEQTISTGEVPGFGRLSALAPVPVEGARPIRPPVKPPFRPDAECRSQRLVDLRAPALAAPPSQPAPDASAVAGLAEDVLEALLPEARR